MSQWVTVRWEDIQGVKRRGVHQLTKKILHWPYCARCGLVALRNTTTRRALRRPCEWWEDK
jgi:hypothetical protein